MKKSLCITVLTVAITLSIYGVVFAQSVFNAQGSTVVPNIHSAYVHSHAFANTYLSISNITNTPVNCKITIYDHEGAEITSLGKVLTGNYVSGSGVTVPFIEGVFEIPAYGTRFYVLADTAAHLIHGHATIKWNSNDPKMSKALIGALKHYGQVGSVHAVQSGTSMINNGQPF
ncbi:hypothetical protein [Desulfovibrio sp. UCD-KL4C]|uniref:hypothetical protein n=1 Tax=Desulfovibrio sp. UCD-KL4C TaxID=2578120 RepID=UPI0025C6C44C|nr:hypothetical protein [Desulfovibrio sp. UCD-KL4C]